MAAARSSSSGIGATGMSTVIGDSDRDRPRLFELHALGQLESGKVRERVVVWAQTTTFWAHSPSYFFISSSSLDVIIYIASIGSIMGQIGRLYRCVC